MLACRIWTLHLVLAFVSFGTAAGFAQEASGPDHPGTTTPPAADTPEPSSRPAKPTSQPAASPKADSARLALPFEPGYQYDFEWRQKGKQVGHTLISVSEHARGYRVLGQWTFAGGGNNIRARSETLIDPQLHPIELLSRSGWSTSNHKQGGKQIEVKCSAGVAEVAVQLPGKEPKKFAVDYPEKAYVYAGNLYEHFLLLGAVLHSGGDHRKLRLLRPTAKQIMEMRFEKQAVEESEHGPLARWRGTHPDMQITLWIDNQGLIRRSLQDGSLLNEITFVKKRQQKATSKPR